VAITRFATGQRFTAAALNGVITEFESYIARTYVKGSTESRASTTTLTNDSELNTIPLDIGTYRIELVGFFTVGSNTPRLVTRWGFTGTWNNPDRVCFGPGATETAAPNVATTVNVQGYQAAGQSATYNIINTAVYTSFREVSMNVVVTAAGSLSLQWAQFSSNAAATAVQPGTAFEIRRIF